MEKHKISIGTKENPTVFIRMDEYLMLARLCGKSTALHGESYVSRYKNGAALLQIDGRRYEGDDLSLVSIEESENTVVCRWSVGNSSLYLTTVWQACPETSIVSRKDTLSNEGESSVIINRCLTRITFPPDLYECYTQESRWCRENQGAWQPLHTGIHLRHAPGRTTEETTPYLALRSIDTEDAIAFHILPLGNWTIGVCPITEGGNLPYASVELGMADENLHRSLSVGETLELPEILVQPLPQGKPHLGAPLLHQYLLRHHFSDSKPQAPVIYNTWFYNFDVLEIPLLREQLAAAADTGCEVFVVDAGWYGAGGSNWFAQTGYWYEKTEAAFQGKMGAFADEVRASGLGFGLWMEPERIGPEAPVLTEKPEWFIPVGDMFRIDLANSAAYNWLRSEIGRLVETYKLAWMKVDFNFTLDYDASGNELHDYTRLWYKILDEVRAAYPGTFFEGCSSGSMRGDIATHSHFDAHFLSDSVNPVDMLRISQGAFLRLLPGRLTRWAVVRSLEKAVPRYGGGERLTDSPPMILTPGGALWEPAESVDLDFTLLVSMLGMMGFSGDLASLSQVHRKRAAEVITFYKEWRCFITSSVTHLLTPPKLLSNRSGWIVFQLQNPEDTSSLLFVYRLGVCRG